MLACLAGPGCSPSSFVYPNENFAFKTSQPAVVAVVAVVVAVEIEAIFRDRKKKYCAVEERNKEKSKGNEEEEEIG